MSVPSKIIFDNQNYLTVEKIDFNGVGEYKLSHAVNSGVNSLSVSEKFITDLTEKFEGMSSLEEKTLYFSEFGYSAQCISNQMNPLIPMPPIPDSSKMASMSC